MIIMSISPSSLRLINSITTTLLCSLFLFAVTTVSARDHIVGRDQGWKPGVNYTLWADNQTFYVGDQISFRYPKTLYNVFQVNETGYDDCSTEGALGNWHSGKDFITLNISESYYFICGNGECFNGMKVSVLVNPLPPPPGPAVASAYTSANSAAPAMAHVQSVVGVILFNFIWIWAVFGWI